MTSYEYDKCSEGSPTVAHAPGVVLISNRPPASTGIIRPRRDIVVGQWVLLLIHAHRQAGTHARMCAGTHACMHTCMYTHTHTCRHMHARTLTYTHTYTHTHTLTHTHTRMHSCADTHTHAMPPLALCTTFTDLDLARGHKVSAKQNLLASPPSPPLPPPHTHTF